MDVYVITQQYVKSPYFSSQGMKFLKNYRISVRITNTDGEPLYDDLIGWTINWFTVSDPNKKILRVDGDFLEGGFDINVVFEDRNIARRLEAMELYIDENYDLKGITDDLKRTTCKDFHPPILLLYTG